ncbi:hypothetical protein [Cyanothece sp. BG0011]|uniref:pPIWI_RE_Z domain-containing protein n=1 Tax=Cyanothece sp. BG0011 TaxID=2082950 RepID=UPI000D1EAA86|nr:hypothetical protein [Cyanothece sp. BG0011]
MRDISSWSRKIRKSLAESNDLQEYVNFEINETKTDKIIKRLARLIVDVELGLTLLHHIAPNEPVTSVSALLLGYRFPVDFLLDEDNWEKIKKVRFYLFRRKGKQWNKSLNEYINLPETVRIFDFNNLEDNPQRIPTTIVSQRYNFYLTTLETVPIHKPQKAKLATSGDWFAKVFTHKNSSEEIPIKIPTSINKLPQVPYLELESRDHSTSNIVTFSELQKAAQEMDIKLAENKQPAANYYKRLEKIAFKAYHQSSDDFQPTNEINIKELVHIVGLLNVGKSTLLEILLYHLAKQKNRCALVVNDVVTAVKIASLFAHQLNIPAAPILGSDRNDHLTKVYEPILSNSGDEITQGGEHPVWRWFSPVCLLLPLVEPENHWGFGEEPCHNLYSKIVIPKNDNDEDEEFKESDYYTCPFYYHCPRHQLEKDIIQAKIWILTPASLVQTRVPKQGFKGKRITFAEAIYHHCNFLFVDEADRVQVQLDQQFCPQENLLDNSKNCFLNKLRNNHNPIYESNRGIMGIPLVEKWTNTQNTADTAINKICNLLYGNEILINWLDRSHFTGISLFASLMKYVEEAAENNQSTPTKSVTEGIASQQEEQRQKETLKDLETFFKSPLDAANNSKLGQIPIYCLHSENEELIISEIEKWWKRYLKNHKIKFNDQEKIQELLTKTYLAILVTILDNRLGYLVDNLIDMGRIIDLHDINQSLVHRPPRDFLPIIPNAPVGNLLGFRYIPERSNRKAGKLEYFRYVGVGRYLLLNFPKLWSVDNINGPHTILISGTSYVPGSPDYHLIEKPSILLVPSDNNKTAGNEGIRSSEFYFSPQQSLNRSNHIAISGKLPKDRKKAVKDMTETIIYKPDKASSFIEYLFETIEIKAKQNHKQWSDRNRILLLVNSYDEAELLSEYLKHSPLKYTINNLEIHCLRRDNSPKEDEGIRRGKITQAIKKDKKQIIIAPLMALERGHNILNDQRIAAFGVAVFVSRPMPVPNDWQITVRQLNNWALNHYLDTQLTQLSNLTEVENKFYQLARNKLYQLNLRSMSFKQLSEEERQVLSLNQFVSIWQVIGRLVRGGVPCLVHFLDLTFAPESVKNETDKETTSLLVAIIKQLEKLLNEENSLPYQKTLATELYGEFFTALQSTENLNYE